MAAKPAAKPAAAAVAADAPKKGFPIVLVAIVLLMGLGIGGGTAYFVLPKPAADANAHDAAAAAKPADKRGPAQYVPLQPAFVVNLADEGSTRYLQAEVQVSSRDPQTVTDLGTHSPAIRNALLMLFAKKTQAELRSVEGREKLQADALSEVNRVLKQEAGREGVDALFFTSFVTQ